MTRRMEAVDILKGLAEPTRLRILNLLRQGPLCVCHIHEVLNLPQAKVSRQLAYLKERSMVSSSRYYKWTLYRLPERSGSLGEQLLDCLGRELFTSGVFQADLERLAEVDTSRACEAADNLEAS